MSTTKKIRAGLYEVKTAKSIFHVEDVHDGQRWIWRVSEPGVFHDGWIGDYFTKREALVAIAGL